MTVQSLLSIGQQTLQVSQYALSVHGNNAANEATGGYSRRTVSFGERDTVTIGGYTVGTGVELSSLTRQVDTFLGSQYLSARSEEARSQTLYDELAGVESLFTESDDYGLTPSLDAFWSAWSDVAQSPGDSAAQTALASTAGTLTDELNRAMTELEEIEDQFNLQINQDVDEINRLAQELADLNKTIGRAGASADLLDTRDQLLIELAGHLDVNVLYDENGAASVKIAGGMSLVEGASATELSFEKAGSSSALTKTSTFDGAAWFEGESPYEYTLEVVGGGDMGTAQFKVSLDGGKSWLTNDDGQTMLYTADGDDGSVTVDGLRIWFGASDDAHAAAGGSLAAGDSFSIIAKSGVYAEDASGARRNLTPQAMPSGTANSNRISGGSLGGLFEARDTYVADYAQELNAFASALAWEVNRVHSVGAGDEHFDAATAGNAVRDSSASIAQSGLDFADRVEAGSLSLALYDSNSGEALGITAIDFSGVASGSTNFDPSVHSLEDVRDAVNASLGGQVTASIDSGRLVLDAADGVSFEFAEDSGGLLAALGVNSFFSGSGAGSIEVSSAITQDPGRIATGHVNGEGEVRSGDNTVAKALAELGEQTVSIGGPGVADSSSKTLGGYLAGIISGVGADVSSAESAYEQGSALAGDIETRMQAVSGVNEDEELSLIMRYQQQYEMAAKLIQVAGEMFDTILSLKD